MIHLPCPVCQRAVQGIVDEGGHFLPCRNTTHDASCAYYLSASSTGGAPLDFFKSVGWLANVGHVLAGLAVILITWTFTHATSHVIEAWGGLVAYAVVKEYWLDLRYESGETVLSSTVDFVGYIGGAGVGTLLVELARAFAH